jgi:hypothetical protein
LKDEIYSLCGGGVGVALQSGTVCITEACFTLLSDLADGSLIAPTAAGRTAATKRAATRSKNGRLDCGLLEFVFMGWFASEKQCEDPTTKLQCFFVGKFAPPSPIEYRHELGPRMAACHAFRMPTIRW